jgi:hypothetical protein
MLNAARLLATASRNMDRGVCPLRPAVWSLQNAYRRMHPAHRIVHPAFRLTPMHQEVSDIIASL